MHRGARYETREKDSFALRCDSLFAGTIPFTSGRFAHTKARIRGGRKDDHPLRFPLQ
jgi:hypothetical protein